MATSNPYNFYNELTKIMDISGIIHNEQDRIDKKSIGISNALDSQNRMIFLNQSYANRMKEYSYMIMIISLTIVIVVFTLVFQNYLPSALVNIITFVVAIIGGIWALWVYLGITNRDNVDFDKVYSIPLNSLDNSGNVFVKSSDTASANQNALNTLLNGECHGGSCCGPETAYNSLQGQCLPASASTSTSISNFTSIEQAYNNGEFTGNILQNYNVMKNSLIFSSYP